MATTVLLQVREPGVPSDVVGWVCEPGKDGSHVAVFLADCDLELLPFFSDFVAYAVQSWQTARRDGWAPTASGELRFPVGARSVPHTVGDLLADLG